MNGKSVLGMIFANIHEEALDSLTAMRTMGSVPFCSRFRLIDFPLSNLVESGVTKIGVVTNANFRSLMDHIGTGKPWGLSRKSDGLFLLPPFSAGSTSIWGNRIDAIFGYMNFLHQSHQTYVLMTDCNNIVNIDYSKLFDAHEKSGADITIVGVKSKMPKNIGSVLCFDKVDENGKITEMSLDRDVDDEVFYSCNIMIMKKYLLETLIQTAHSKNEISFQEISLWQMLKTLIFTLLMRLTALSAQLIQFKATIKFLCRFLRRKTEISFSHPLFQQKNVTICLPFTALNLQLKIHL
mgnify:CR=1 FL=1